MGQRERGLYEMLITEALDADLKNLDGRLEAQRSGLHEAEAADRFALHLSRVLAAALVGSHTLRIVLQTRDAQLRMREDDSWCRSAGVAHPWGLPFAPSSGTTRK